jgi:4-amino-4-deoxy-L-arabinose transferase-like glycosyltransferase
MNMKKPTQFRIEPLIAIPFLLVWIAGISLRFFYHDERFHLLHYLLSSLANIALLCFIVLAAFCAGEKLWRRLKLHFDTCLETFVFSTAVGLGIISYSVLILGNVRLLYRTPCYLLLASIIAASIPQIRSFLKRLRDERQGQAEKSAMQSIDSPFMTALKVIFVISICLYLVQVFSPPLNYDSLAYHLAIPKIYAQEHHVSCIPHNVYANFPMTMEFLYVLGLLLRGDILAKMMHFFMGILTALAIYSFSKRYFERKTALVASLIFYNIPLVGLLSGWAFNDLMLTAYEFLAVAAIANWFLSNQPKEENWLWASAIFCGLSIGTKYPALLFLLPFSLLAIVIKLMGQACLTPTSEKTNNPVGDGHARPANKVAQKGNSYAIKKLALFLLITLLVASPWFIKNAFYTHNPVYPFFYGFFNKVFGDPGGGIFDTQRFMKHHRPQNFQAGQIFTLLWRTNMDNKIGPAFILFLPLLLFIRPVKPALKLLLLFAGLYFVLWTFFTHQDTRFLIPSLPALCIGSAYVITGITGKSKPLTLFVHMVILFVAFFNLSWMPLTIARYGLLKVAVGVEDRNEFLMGSAFYQYSAFDYINNELPGDARILFVGENQTYYCDREIVSNSPLDMNIIVEIINRSSSQKEIRNELNSLGITHVLYNASEIKRVAEHYNSFNWAGEDARELFMDFMSSEKYLTEVFSDGGVFVSELKK